MIAGNGLLAIGAISVAVACVGAMGLVLRGDPASREMNGRLRGLSANAAPAAAAPRRRDIRKNDTTSPLVALLARLGRSRNIPKEWRLAWPVIIAITAMVASGGGMIGTRLFGSALGLLTGAAVTAFVLQFLFRWEVNRYKGKIFTQIPEALGLILRAIRAGLPVAEALGNVAKEIGTPSKEEYSRLAGEIAIGRPVEAALFGLAERTDLTEYYFFAVTVGLQAQTGGSLGETLENLSEIVRKRVALAGKVKAMTAEARMSASILTGLPFVVSGLILILTPQHLEPLVYTSTGNTMLMVGGGLMSIGLFVIRMLMRNALKD